MREIDLKGRLLSPQMKLMARITAPAAAWQNLLIICCPLPSLLKLPTIHFRIPLLLRFFLDANNTKRELMRQRCWLQSVTTVKKPQKCSIFTCGASEVRKCFILSPLIFIGLFGVICTQLCWLQGVTTVKIWLRGLRNAAFLPAAVYKVYNCSNLFSLLFFW